MRSGVSTKPGQAHEVPVRQWVLTLPYPLRYRCAWNARLTSEIPQAFLRAAFADQRRRPRKLVLDGVYAGPSPVSVQCGPSKRSSVVKLDTGLRFKRVG